MLTLRANHFAEHRLDRRSLIKTNYGRQRSSVVPVGDSLPPWIICTSSWCTITLESLYKLESISALFRHTWLAQTRYNNCYCCCTVVLLVLLFRLSDVSIQVVLLWFFCATLVSLRGLTWKRHAVGVRPFDKSQLNVLPDVPVMKRYMSRHVMFFSIM